MILSLMRFRGFQWHHNPIEISISEEIESNTVALGNKGERLGEGMRKCTVIKGKGELVGKDAIKNYETLSRLFNEKKTGILTIPGLAPLRASFTALKAEADSTPDVVRYSFAFSEVDSTDKRAFKKETYIASQGENLFDIAHREEVPLELLVAMNPGIRYIDCLSEGEVVRLC